MYLASARLAAAAGLGNAFCRAASNDSWTMSLITGYTFLVNEI
jgi:hypothetical protein